MEGETLDDKAMSQLIHAQLRCEERLGYRPSAGELLELGSRIESGQCPILEEQSRGRFVYRARLRSGLEVAVAYDSRTRAVCTIMPLSWSEPGAQRPRDGRKDQGRKNRQKTRSRYTDH